MTSGHLDTEESLAARKRRLSEGDDRTRFEPWVRARNLLTCQLYWMPVREFPVGTLQRRWLIRFYELLLARLTDKQGLAPELFLQMKSISDNHRNLFIQTSRRFHPLFGLGRFPGRALPAPPDKKYAEDLGKGRIQYDPKSLQPDYAYWFLEKHAAEQLALFVGLGGITALFMKPEEPPEPIVKPKPETIHDPKMRAMVEQAPLDEMMGRLQSLQSPFLKKSKETFAADLVEDPQYPGWIFVLPLFGTAGFLNASEEDIGRWFSLFDVYLRESMEDGGMLLASKNDLEQDLEAVLQQMREEGATYPL
jgi:hypothetical protein